MELLNSWVIQLESLDHAARLKYLHNLWDFYVLERGSKPPKLTPDFDSDYGDGIVMNFQFRDAFLYVRSKASYAARGPDGTTQDDIPRPLVFGNEMRDRRRQQFDMDCALSRAVTFLANNIHNQDIERYRIAKLQARNTGIIAALTTFCASISASSIVDLSTRRRMQYTEALPPPYT